MEKEKYDPTFGDDRKCTCGHTYFSHFDILTQIWSVSCPEFKEEE